MKWLLLLALSLAPGANASVSDGQAISAAITNAAFMDKNTTTTFTTALADIRGGVEVATAADSTSTGALQNVTLTYPITSFTNASLSSIQNLTFTNRTDATLVTLKNKTGGTLTLKNLSGGTAANQIDTGIGADLAMPDGTSVNLFYNTVLTKWQIITAAGADVSASNITVGTLPIARGGTNATSQTANGVAYYDGSKITSGSNLTTTGTNLTVGGTVSVGGNILLNSHYLSNDGGNEGISVDNSGGVTLTHASSAPSLVCASGSTTCDITGGNRSISPGGSNAAGGNVTINGGLGTGTGASELSVWMPLLKASGSTAQDTLHRVLTVATSSTTAGKVQVQDTMTVGAASGTTGSIGLLGTTSGTVTIQPQAAAGTYNFNLPITAGSANQLLYSGAGGSTAMAWTSATYPTGTVNQGEIVNASGSNVYSSTPTPTLGKAGTTTGTLSFGGLTSGTITIQPQSAAGTYNFNLPITVGSAGTVLTSQGGGSTAMTWSSILNNPATAAYDTVYQNAGNTALTNLANGTTGQVYMATSSAAPSWATVKGNSTILKAPTTQTFNSTGTAVGWLFTISTSSTVAVGDTYTNNSNTYTVQVALTAQSGQVLWMSGTGATSGTTLTRSAGAGTASITFSTKVATATYTAPTSPSPLYIKIRMIGGGGGGSGAGTGSSGGAGANGLLTAIGLATPVYATGGTGGVDGGSGAGGTGGSIGSASGKCFDGGMGGGGAASSGTSIFEAGGMGGSGAFGGAGAGGPANSAGSNASANTGGGGGGGGTGAAASQNGGGGGGSGTYCDGVLGAPAATYPYVIGTGGAKGTAGTSGFAGGDGAAGVMIVDEYYQ